MLPNFVEYCTYIFWKSCGWATVSEKHVDRKAVVEVRSTRAAMPSLRWAESRMRWLFSCMFLWKRKDDLKGEAWRVEPTAGKNNRLRNRTVLIKETSLSCTLFVKEGDAGNKYLAGFQNSYNQWLLCASHSLPFFFFSGSVYCGYLVIVFPMLNIGGVHNLSFQFAGLWIKRSHIQGAMSIP